MSLLTSLLLLSSLGLRVEQLVTSVLDVLFEVCSLLLVSLLHPLRSGLLLLRQLFALIEEALFGFLSMGKLPILHVLSGFSLSLAYVVTLLVVTLRLPAFSVAVIFQELLVRRECSIPKGFTSGLVTLFKLLSGAA